MSRRRQPRELKDLYYERPIHSRLAVLTAHLTRTWVAVVYSKIVTDHSLCAELAHYPGLPLRVLERV